MRLSSPTGNIASHYDAVVIGSGYGGGVAASRLARMGYRVAVLERGLEIQPGEFPDTAASAAAQFQADTPLGRVGDKTALFDLHTGSDMSVLVGCGLGGTSLINANVALKADSRAFDDPSWPSGLNDADLAAGYEAAEAMMRPTPYPIEKEGWPDLNKLKAMRAAGAALGQPASCPPINVCFEAGENAAGVHQPACNLCGDCCSGCNTGAKTTTAMTYLPDAVNFGAEIFCAVEVRSIERTSDGWHVDYRLPVSGRENFDGPELTVTADMVVLAAGTLGSTEILLRSRGRGLPMSNRIGSKFSGNGDVLAFSYNNDEPIDGVGVGHEAADFDHSMHKLRPVGPTIAGLIDLRNDDDLDAGMVIEEGAIPGGLGSLLPAMMGSGALAFGTDTDVGDWTEERLRSLESILRGPYHGAVNHTQTFLVMAHDDADGQLEMEDDRLSVQWPDVGERPVFSRIAARLKQAAAATGGTYTPNPIWTELMDHQLVTVHPLGGCPMGDDAESGVVNGDCQVFSSTAGTGVHEGLYVCDGAVIPRSLGVNPLLTISAIAERAMIKLAAANGRTITQEKAIAPVNLEQLEKPGIRFTERMAGEISRADGTAQGPASFIVTVDVDDADKFLRDPAHAAQIFGTVELAPLSPAPMSIAGGSFNLFSADPARVETRQMEYKLPLVADDGRQFFFYGQKSIHDDAGFDMWHDTTTLAVSIHAGTDSSGPVVASGELKIQPADFIRQLRTMTVTGADNLSQRLEIMRRFGFFFAGQLFSTFGGAFARPSLFDPSAQRVRRALRVREPEVHWFTTADGLKLRLLRYRGGDKGPVLFSHGLGVSSLIFSIDTIDTNLLEYIYAAGYDCWLLDHRASIDLPYAKEQFNADDLAQQDYRPAINLIRAVADVNHVKIIAHCYGAMTLSMSILEGLENVRSVVLSQISTHAHMPFFPQRMLAYLRAANVMRFVGAKVLDARANVDRDWLARFIDAGLGSVYPYRSDNRTRSATSRRITAMYGQLYQLDKLNQATLDAMPEMFGKACIEGFLQLALIARKGTITKADGTNDYLTDEKLRRFAIPTLFVHGGLNRAFLPSGTQETMSNFSRVNGPELYDRLEVQEAGHLDCIFGKEAVETVYPHILRHLDQT